MAPFVEISYSYVSMAKAVALLLQAVCNNRSVKLPKQLHNTARVNLWHSRRSDNALLRADVTASINQ